MNELEDIHHLAGDALKALSKNDIPTVMVHLAEIRAKAGNSISVDTAWQLIREQYERGIPPRLVARDYAAYGITARAITQRAYTDRWASPAKIQKAVKKPGGKKNTFYPVCRLCEKKFEAYSGHALICPTCKAMQVMGG